MGNRVLTREILVKHLQYDALYGKFYSLKTGKNSGYYSGEYGRVSITIKWYGQYKRTHLAVLWNTGKLPKEGNQVHHINEVVDQDIIPNLLEVTKDEHDRIHFLRKTRRKKCLTSNKNYLIKENMNGYYRVDDKYQHQTITFGTIKDIGLAIILRDRVIRETVDIKEKVYTDKDSYIYTYCNGYRVILVDGILKKTRKFFSIEEARRSRDRYIAKFGRQ